MIKWILKDAGGNRTYFLGRADATPEDSDASRRAGVREASREGTAFVAFARRKG
jgi:hypothetical protein